MLRTTPLLNSDLLRALATAGHGHTVVIADAGLPIPSGAHVIDLAVVPGLPGFAEVARAILDNAVFEAYVVASESVDSAPVAALAELLGGLPATVVDHEEFKSRLAGAHVIVRTGECTPYANIALISGTTF